ncbi:hypothetical protein KSS87_008904 [Heliosperma pusillum]|nr:hypothetical protein KSS87_008903 [Heliosperma pusillum]KAH9618491.1 hypothetical protein KSS87_008904 [Heliosperma pusillum]
MATKQPPRHRYRAKARHRAELMQDAVNLHK